MGIFNTFVKKNIKHVYFAGWEVEFNNDERNQKFIETQGIDKKTAYSIFSAIELEFEDGKLVRAFDMEEGDKQSRELTEEELGQPFFDAPVHSIFNLEESSDGKSYLGGETPKEFNIPKFDFIAPFQYIGKVSKSDEPFLWLPFDLHLTAPLFLELDKIFLDYTDPMNPRVLDLEELKKTESPFGNLKSDSEIVFQKKYFRGRKSNYIGDDMEESVMGHTGVPSWIQFPDIPSCPKSKKTMKFVMQLRSTTGIQTERSNVVPSNDGLQRYLEKLNFAADGDLFVFFEPESKVACFLIQNT
ncbi:hypothetical protein [Algoriphagus halophilus]|uniref:Uncharacterized protein n=1 Tax=Algoriphagus halophilus TaxID=226505 RepID=A0A1N6D6I9_9BACT|nr:hypothetical protein [Algoriphagus halophilus]SIN66401.1 hypothetical protein SAMN05444394_0337 [Algoriphagus halophilus]